MSADIFQLIGTYGFPIVISVYLLWERRHRDDSFITELKSIITSNTEALSAIKEVMQGCKKT